MEINNYFKETVREEGLPTLLDPDRFEQHVEQIARVITETAQTQGITLATTQLSEQQINQVAAELFKTVGPQLEHANTQFAITQELTAQLETTTHLTDHALAQISATQQVGANGEHAANVTFNRQNHDREREREQQGKQPSTPTTKIQDQASREPNPQSVTKAPELSPATSPTAAIGNGPEVGASIEEAAALVLV